MPAEALPYIIIAAVALALIAATVVVSRVAWRKQVRRYLVGLVGRRESIGAALKALEGVMATLATGSVDDLIAFADSESEERRTFAELGGRMHIETQELAQLPLPKSLWQLADALGAAASNVAEQASRVGDAHGEAALDALAVIDFGPARTALSESDGYIATLSTVYDLTDPSVYGGGLYI